MTESHEALRGQGAQVQAVKVIGIQRKALSAEAQASREERCSGWRAWPKKGPGGSCRLRTQHRKQAQMQELGMARSTIFTTK